MKIIRKLIMIRKSRHTEISHKRELNRFQYTYLSISVFNRKYPIQIHIINATIGGEGIL